MGDGHMRHLSGIELHPMNGEVPSEAFVTFQEDGTIFTWTSPELFDGDKTFWPAICTTYFGYVLVSELLEGGFIRTKAEVEATA
jgi:hypothetical protein